MSIPQWEIVFLFLRPKDDLQFICMAFSQRDDDGDDSTVVKCDLYFGVNVRLFVEMFKRDSTRSFFRSPLVRTKFSDATSSNLQREVYDLGFPTPEPVRLPREFYGHVEGEKISVSPIIKS